MPLRHVLALLALVGCAGDSDPKETGLVEDTDVPVDTDLPDDTDPGDTDPDDDDLDDDGSPTGEDCDDADPTAYPGNDETWYDGVDNDCDGRSDYDQDRDGVDSDLHGGTDCDDTDPLVNPGTLEDGANGVDDDCDGEIDESLTTSDVDGDGWTEADGDCNDRDGAVNPAAAERWYDGVDQDCNGLSDYDADYDGHDADAHGGGDCDDSDATISPSAPETWYDGVDQDCDGASDADQDGDGVDSDAHGGADCDDLDPTVNPGAIDDWYDGVDQDCDGASDFDQDADGYDDQGFGGKDCDDTAADISPDGLETCDGVDQNCDGTIDDGAMTTWYADTDGDGFGSAASATLSCVAPVGYVAVSTDCNDAAAAAHPGGTETCDSLDNDCDGTVDDGVGTTWYRDADGDGYGTLAGATSACTAPAGYVALSTDCNDAAVGINPAAREVCDGLDNDCNLVVDGGLPVSTYYADADGDGYGDPTVTKSSCAQPAGYVGTNTDCDDDAASAYPGHAEDAYDHLDNDCDGYPDVMVADTESDWSVTGGDGGDYLGNVAVTPDLDGDGSAELVVCSPYVDYYYYWSYGDMGGCSFHDAGNKADARSWWDGNFELRGNDAEDRAGSAFGLVGAYSGSGLPMVVIGTMDNDVNATNDGTVYIVDASEVQYSYTASGWASGAVYGSATDGRWGYSIATGDFDGDGNLDFAGGAPGESSAKGRVYVGFYSDSYFKDTLDNDELSFYVTGVGDADRLGYSVAFGDFGNDGYDDLVACAPGDDDGGTDGGTCWIVPGSVSRSSGITQGLTISDLDSAVITGVTGDTIGLTPDSLAVGDLDDDGVADLAVGAPGYDGAVSNGGGAWVFAGGTLAGSETVATASWSVRGDGAAGTGLSMDGDVDGDDIVDLLVGAPLAGSNGRVYLFSGGQAPGTYTLPADQHASWIGEAGSDLFGTTIAGLLDLDADGLLDFAVSSPGNDDADSAAGKVHVIPAYR